MKILQWLNPCKSKANKALAKAEKRQQQADENVKILLECERKAKVIIANAQERRKNSKVRAKNEADKELADFRKEREKKFKTFCENADKDTEKMKKTIESDIDKKIEKIDAQVKEHRDKVIKMLLENVVKIEPSVHRNLQPIKKASNTKKASDISKASDIKKVNDIKTESTQSIKE